MGIEGPNSSARTEILIVEDSPTQAERLRYTLEVNDYIVHTARNGKEAIDFLKRRKPTIVISDIMMPEVDGYQLCREMKATDGLKDIPVILLTTLSEPEDIISGLECGADNFITKPYSEQFLVSRIEYIQMNTEIRRNANTEMGIEIVFAGKKYLINSNRFQMLDLLLSTYENAIQKSRELEKAYRELKNVQEKLQEAKEAAEAASRYKSEFLANMSHEIRTPMSAIIGMTDIVLDTEMTPDQKEYLSIVKQSADSLLTLLNDILDLSKIEAGKIELETIDFNLSTIFENILSMFAVQAKEKNLDLDFHIEKDVPAILTGDPARIRQIIVNLVSNAIKFTEKGGVIVEARKKGPGPTPSSVELLFSIKDTGIGIPEEKQMKIFESFIQADGSTTRKYGGTGLGLAICEELVKMMDGNIWVRSLSGEGSTFYFTLVLDLAKAPEAALCRPGEGTQAPEIVGAKTALSILLVEDNIINQKLATIVLEKMGHKVTLAGNGKEALAALGKERFSLIFMDVQMPEMDGIETTRAIRGPGHKNYGPDIPIIAMTAYAMNEDRDRCFEAGMNDHISKPLNVNEIAAIMEKYFPRR